MRLEMTTGPGRRACQILDEKYELLKKIRARCPLWAGLHVNIFLPVCTGLFRGSEQLIFFFFFFLLTGSLERSCRV